MASLPVLGKEGQKAATLKKGEHVQVTGTLTSRKY